METAEYFNKEYKILDKFTIQYHKLEGVIGMGGPTVGKIKFNNILLDGYFSGPPRISDDNKLLVIPKFYRNTKREFISKNRFIYKYFSIIIIDLEKQLMYESQKRYQLLFIEKMVDNNIIFYNACHNQLPDTKELLIFNDDNFKLVRDI